MPDFLEQNHSFVYSVKCLVKGKRNFFVKYLKTFMVKRKNLVLTGTVLQNIPIVRNVWILIYWGIKVMKHKKPVSLRRKLLFLITICWIVPVILIFLYITLSYRNSIIEKTEMLMEEWAKNFTSLHGQKIDEAITISKKPSYELVIEKHGNDMGGDHQL